MEAAETKKKSHRLFLDDTEYQSFIRRLAWSPDGQFLLTPGSWFQDLQQMSSPTNSSNFQYTVYGFLKTQINKPAFMLPGIKSHATCIRFSPYLYKLAERQDDDPPAMLALPYRIIFAIATIDNILLYHTQSIMPIAILKSIHYDSINDMSWMGTSLLLTASSDGFCSFIQLDSHLVGEQLELDSPAMPEDLKEHYDCLYKVNFQS
jgi:chromatin assembly factor 1 subunit B